MATHTVNGSTYLITRGKKGLSVRNTKGQYVKKDVAKAVKKAVFTPKKYRPKPNPPKIPTKNIYEYTIYSQETGKAQRKTTFEARTTLEIEGDPYSKSNINKAMSKIKRGYDRLNMSQINDILDTPEVRGVRKVKEPMEGVEIGTIKTGTMYRAIGGKKVEKLIAGAWKQTKWIKEGGRWIMKAIK